MSMVTSNLDTGACVTDRWKDDRTSRIENAVYALALATSIVIWLIALPSPLWLDVGGNSALLWLCLHWRPFR
jgi:hypothetical protein